MALLLGRGAALGRDAERVQVVAVGRSPAVVASEGLDASNARRSRVPFPQNPELTLRLRLNGGIGQAPAADEAGNLIILHSEPRISKLDANARTVWTERLPSEASSAPVLLASGSILV